ncbi:glycosyltransferase [Saxibacter everestensis]|uniref:D-inositol 3-phosphate glycosyltransferase n=1 Tax=Saxibacter everestensis TaxID=2909229 RepID=A0ABY8QRZ3_9MICO|nr:glycosyltransferase [Brevibacteriaceae bacterium ZFBP1038]
MTDASSGGVLTSVTTLARQQAEHPDRHEVIFAFVPRSDTPAKEQIQQLTGPRVNVQQWSTTTTIRRLIDLVHGLSRTLARTQCDVVHLHSSRAGFLGRFIAVAVGGSARVVYSPHAFAFAQAGMHPHKRAIYLTLERMAVRWDSKLILVSETERDVATKYLPGSRTAVLPNAVNTAELLGYKKPSASPRMSQPAGARIGTVAHAAVAQQGTKAATGNQVRSHGSREDRAATDTLVRPDSARPNGSRNQGGTPNGTRQDSAGPNGARADGSTPSGGQAGGVTPNGAQQTGGLPGKAATVRTIVHIGRIAEQKAPTLFGSVIQLLDERLAEVPDLAARALWLGEGDRKLLGSNARFVEVSGWLAPDELRHKLAAADLVLFTSRGEGMPLALLEAQAIGLPIVASKVTGVTDIVDHGRTGFLADTAEELADHVFTLLRDDELRVQMGFAASHRSAAHFDQRSLAQRSLQAYLSLNLSGAADSISSMERHPTHGSIEETK